MVEAFYFFLVNYLLIFSVSGQGTYRAAVVEYSPRVTAYSATDLLLENAGLYITYIEQAAEAGVQIIVFPEDGLTGLNIWIDATEESLKNYSTFVPEIKDEIAPCDDTSYQNYSRALVDLSCSARTNSIYTVINVLERVNGSGNITILYNTDVVFDRNGVVISKYRKINLFYEPFLTPGNTPVTFQTDFGVKFGIFTCFDILFKNPGVDVLNDTITDIIYPVAWFSEVPFLQALSVQAGYSRSNGLNLLAAGLSNATNTNGGSGIYLANGTIAETYISAASASKMIIRDIPIISERQVSCQESSRNIDNFRKVSGQGFLPAFKTYDEDLSNYTTSNLNLTSSYSSITLCQEGSNFCCTFNISTNLSSVANSDLVYKLVVFNGIRKLGETSTGNQICSLVACLADDIESCGQRRPTPMSGILFESINITGIFLSPPSGYIQPVTLTTWLTPIQDYNFCTSSNGNDVEASIRLASPQNSLLTFGIYGRVFSNDGGAIGRSTANFNSFCMLSVIFLSLLTFLQQRIIS